MKMHIENNLGAGRLVLVLSREEQKNPHAATLMHSKIKDFNFIHIISRISIKTSTSEGIKSVKQSHENHLSAVPNHPSKNIFMQQKNIIHVHKKSTYSSVLLAAPTHPCCHKQHPYNPHLCN